DMLNPWHNGGGLNPNSSWGKDYQAQYGGPSGDTCYAADLIATDIIPIIWWGDSLNMANSPGYFKDKGFDYLVSPYCKKEDVKNWAGVLRDRKDGLGMLDSTWSEAGSFRWNGLVPSADYSWCYNRAAGSWYFNENSGIIANDASLNNNHGIINGAGWTGGISGSALLFDGNDYVEIADAANLNLANAITLEAWINIPEYPAVCADIISKYNGGVAGSYLLSLAPDGRIYFSVESTWSSITSNQTISLNDWHYVTVVFDGETKFIYIDGQLDVQNIGGGLINHATPVLIGARFINSTPAYYFNGTIDEVSIYDVALNAGEILEKYNSLKPEEISIAIDGNFDDWKETMLLGTDATGDISQGDKVDWEKVWGCDKEGKLYLSYQTASSIDFISNAWRYGIYIDTDNNASTGFRGCDGSFNIGAEYLIEGSTLYQYTGDGTSWGWFATEALNYACAGNRYEAAISENALGLSGDYSIQLLLIGNNPTTADFAKDDKSGFEYSK
ncbi:MAG: LamG domain-containing protein, partial [Candidatus Omnitrophota bacterium]